MSRPLLNRLHVTGVNGEPLCVIEPDDDGTIHDVTVTWPLTWDGRLALGRIEQRTQLAITARPRFLDPT